MKFLTSIDAKTFSYIHITYFFCFFRLNNNESVYVLINGADTRQESMKFDLLFWYFVFVCLFLYHGLHAWCSWLNRQLVWYTICTNCDRKPEELGDFNFVSSVCASVIRKNQFIEFRSVVLRWACPLHHILFQVGKQSRLYEKGIKKTTQLQNFIFITFNLKLFNFTTTFFHHTYHKQWWPNLFTQPRKKKNLLLLKKVMQIRYDRKRIKKGINDTTWKKILNYIIDHTHLRK